MPVYVPGGVHVIPVTAVDGLIEALQNIAFIPSIIENTPSRISQISDAGNYLRFTAESTQTYTVVGSSFVSWEPDCEIHGRNAGVGALTIVPGTGVTINPPYLGTLVVPLGGTFTLKRVGSTDEWDLFGQTVAE